MRDKSDSDGGVVSPQHSAITVALICPDPAFSAQAEKLAKQLGLPIDLPIDLPLPRSTEQYRPEQYQLLLRVSEQGLELIKPNDPNLSGAIRVDFTTGQATFRRKQHKKELLLRAVGCKAKMTPTPTPTMTPTIMPTMMPTIMDGTGGMGRDSFLLAAAGCQVRIFEREPIIAALLADGLERAAAHPETAEIACRIQLTAGDIITTLQDMQLHEQHINVIYLDPMFPERHKSALVKKDLQILKLLANIDSSPEQLLTAAIKTADNRVVVKRPIKAPFLTDLAPSHSLNGKTVRFDVYITGSIKHKLISQQNRMHPGSKDMASEE